MGGSGTLGGAAGGAAGSGTLGEAAGGAAGRGAGWGAINTLR